jgi:hypothetical protein
MIAACVAGAVPLWIPMVDIPRTYLLMPLIALVIYVLHMLVMLKAVSLATTTFGKTLESGEWNELVLTGLDARQILCSKAWAVIRLTWRDYVLAALPKLGLAMGFASFLYVIINMETCYRHFGAVCYWSDNFGSWYNFAFVATLVSPSLIVLIVFALCELVLIVLLSTITTLLTRSRMVGVALSLAVRFGIIVVFTWVSYILIALSYQSRLDWWNQIRWQWMSCVATNFQQTFCPARAELVDIIQLWLSPFIDNGFLLATDLNRVGTPSIIAAQQSIIIAAAILTYFYLIKLLFGLAVRIAMRRRALQPRPVDEDTELVGVQTAAAIR